MASSAAILLSFIFSYARPEIKLKTALKSRQNDDTKNHDDIYISLNSNTQNNSFTIKTGLRQNAEHTKAVTQCECLFSHQHKDGLLQAYLEADNKAVTWLSKFEK